MLSHKDYKNRTENLAGVFCEYNKIFESRTKSFLPVLPGCYGNKLRGKMNSHVSICASFAIVHESFKYRKALLQKIRPSEQQHGVGKNYSHQYVKRPKY